MVSYDARIQLAEVADPDDETKRVLIDTSLLTCLQPMNDDNAVSLLGEVCLLPNSPQKKGVRPRVSCVIEGSKGKDLDFVKYRKYLEVREDALKSNHWYNT